MNPTTIDLFTMALGLHHPWTCTKIDFSSTLGKLDIWVDFSRGARFLCPTCGSQEYPMHNMPDKGASSEIRAVQSNKP